MASQMREKKVKKPTLRLSSAPLAHTHTLHFFRMESLTSKEVEAIVQKFKPEKVKEYRGVSGNDLIQHFDSVTKWSESLALGPLQMNAFERSVRNRGQEIPSVSVNTIQNATTYNATTITHTTNNFAKAGHSSPSPEDAPTNAETAEWRSWCKAKEGSVHTTIKDVNFTHAAGVVFDEEEGTWTCKYLGIGMCTQTWKKNDKNRNFNNMIAHFTTAKHKASDDTATPPPTKKRKSVKNNDPVSLAGFRRTDTNIECLRCSQTFNLNMSAHNLGAHKSSHACSHTPDKAKCKREREFKAQLLEKYTETDNEDEESMLACHWCKKEELHSITDKCPTCMEYSIRIYRLRTPADRPENNRVGTKVVSMFPIFESTKKDK